jgi:hypothetical protein
MSGFAATLRQERKKSWMKLLVLKGAALTSLDLRFGQSRLGGLIASVLFSSRAAGAVFRHRFDDLPLHAAVSFTRKPSNTGLPKTALLQKRRRAA